jgi:hypothetical protein
MLHWKGFSSRIQASSCHKERETRFCPETGLLDNQGKSHLRQARIRPLLLVLGHQPNTVIKALRSFDTEMTLCTS